MDWIRPSRRPRVELEGASEDRRATIAAATVFKFGLLMSRLKPGPRKVTSQSSLPMPARALDCHRGQQAAPVPRWSCRDARRPGDRMPSVFRVGFDPLLGCRSVLSLAGQRPAIGAVWEAMPRGVTHRQKSPSSLSELAIPLMRTSPLHSLRKTHYGHPSLYSCGSNKSAANNPIDGQ